MGSSRYPGKPLTPILGRPMIEHVYKRSALCSLLDEVAVATPDEEIFAAVEAFGGRAVMTSPDHTRASDRVAEAAEETGGDIVLNIQGDEPLIHPEMVELAVRAVADDRNVFCSNLIAKIGSDEELRDRNTIKVVRDNEGFALYFSREPIPTLRYAGAVPAQAYKQVCVIPFWAETLKRFLELPPTELELAESIDMLRILQHGYRVKLVESPYATHAVDVVEDVAVVEEIMRGDSVTSRY
jgi:3-deoxy-manno-octulosonate cytidylyltransferase (CMP-KDO synthetase)